MLLLGCGRAPRRAQIDSSYTLRGVLTRSGRCRARHRLQAALSRRFQFDDQRFLRLIAEVLGQVSVCRGPEHLSRPAGTLFDRPVAHRRAGGLDAQRYHDAIWVRVKRTGILRGQVM